MLAEVVEVIRKHAREEYPNECCGALVGSERTVVEVMPLPNTTEQEVRRRFLIRAEDYRRAEAQAAHHGEELLGFYHSHPDHPAWPSLYDLEHAWPNLDYVIVAVDSIHVGEMTAWRLAEERSGFEQEEIVVGTRE